MKKRHLFFICFLFLIGSCHTTKTPESTDLEGRVKRITLNNGMRVLLLNRGTAPVFSSTIYIKAGVADEKTGQSGLSHFLEHMAFKGTEKIATTDFQKESEILTKIEDVGTQLVTLRQQEADAKIVQELENTLTELEKQASHYIDTSEIMKVYMQNGGYDVNANTANDRTLYKVSLPSNKLELWAYLESERYQKKILREFFKEDRVVAEERRMSIDNQTEGRIYEAFLNAAFDQSPYRNPVVGLAKDIQGYTPAMARAYYEKYYIPSRTVLTLVGQFDMTEAEKIIRKYFGSLPAKDDPEKEFAGEQYDPSRYPRVTSVEGNDEPRFWLGYYRPSSHDPDDITFDVLSELLCGGQTSRLYKKLVIDQQKASEIECGAATPGGRLDNYFVVIARPMQGVTNEELARLVRDEMKVLATDGPSAQELQKVLNHVQAQFIYPLEDNMGLATNLGYFELIMGGWEYLVKYSAVVEKLTVDDLKRVAQKYFVPQREVATYYEKK